MRAAPCRELHNSRRSSCPLVSITIEPPFIQYWSCLEIPVLSPVPMVCKPGWENLLRIQSPHAKPFLAIRGPPSMDIYGSRALASKTHPLHPVTSALTQTDFGSQLQQQTTVFLSLCYKKHGMRKHWKCRFALWFQILAKHSKFSTYYEQ